MAHKKDIIFTKRLFTLQQIIKRRPEFPIIVKTCNKLPSFKEVPIEEEGKIIFIESKENLAYARVKVLKILNEKKILPESGAEFHRSHTVFVGEEFYIPLGFPGKLRVIQYPWTRRRYANVSEILEENPRYLQSKDDIMSVPPKHNTDNCLVCIPIGTIIEPKTIEHHNKVRYLKCVDSKGRCLYLREDCPANFTRVQDVKEYTLQQIWDADFLLPTPIQFEPGTISPHDVVFFHDAMASNNLNITNGPLEVLEIVTIKTLIARVRERCCFKTLLLPQTFYKTFHVQEAEFRTFELKSRFVERKFGGCHGDNDFIFSKMYLMPASGELVCWLRNPILLSRDANFCESSESDSEYADTLEENLVTKAEAPPPIPEKTYIQNQEKTRRGSTVLLPTVKIHDQDAQLKVRKKLKLFGKIHAELKRLFRRKSSKKKRLLSESSFSSINDSTEDLLRPNTQSPKPTDPELMYATSMKATKEKKTNKTSKNTTKSSNKTRAPLPLPQGTSFARTASSDDEVFIYGHIDNDTVPLLPSNREETKVTSNETSEKKSHKTRAPLPSLPQDTSLTATASFDDNVYNYVDNDSVSPQSSNRGETKVTLNQTSEKKIKSSHITKSPLPPLPRRTFLTVTPRSDNDDYGYNYIELDMVPLPPPNSEETKVTPNQKSENEINYSHKTRAPLPSLPQGTPNSEETKVTSTQTSENKINYSKKTRAPLPPLPRRTSLTATANSDDGVYGYNYIEMDTVPLPPPNSKETKVTLNQTSENEINYSHKTRAPLPSLPQGTPNNEEIKVTSNHTSENEINYSHKTRAPLPSLPQRTPKNEETKVTCNQTSENEINYSHKTRAPLPPLPQGTPNSEETKVTCNQTSVYDMKYSLVTRNQLPPLPQEISLTATDSSDDEMYECHDYIDTDTVSLATSNSDKTRATTNQTPENKLKSSHVTRAPLPSLPQEIVMTAADSSDDEMYECHDCIDTVSLVTSNREKTRVTTYHTSENKLKSCHVTSAQFSSLPEEIFLTATDSSDDEVYGCKDYINIDTVPLPDSNGDETRVTTNQTSENKLKSCHVTKTPLFSFLQEIFVTATDSSDDEVYGCHDYIDIDTVPLPTSNSKYECETLTVSLEAISLKSHVQYKTAPQTSAASKISEACRSDLSNQQPSIISNTEPSFLLSQTIDLIDVAPETNSENVYYLTPVENKNTHQNQKPHHLVNIDFFSYSIKETIECLKYCGLEHLAYICKDQMLDGEFFENTDKVLIKELLNLSGLDIIKLRKIYNGWRPKYD